jgi:hypothetical protein
VFLTPTRERKLLCHQAVARNSTLHTHMKRLIILPLAEEARSCDQRRLWCEQAHFAPTQAGIDLTAGEELRAHAARRSCDEDKHTSHPYKQALILPLAEERKLLPPEEAVGELPPLCTGLSAPHSVLTRSPATRR